MATPPVFSVGATLTAAQLNSAGLWRITTCTVTSAGGTAATASNGVITVGSGNTSVTIANAFSSDFDSYLIIYTGGTMSASTALTLKLGTTATGYYGVYNYADYATAAWAGAVDNNGASFTYFGGGDSNSCAGRMTLLAPNLAKPTRVESGPIHYGNNFGTYTGIEASTTQHTAFTIAPFTGTMTSGKIRIYGYNN